MSSSSTSNSKNPASSVPIASSSNGWGGVPQLYLNNFLGQVENNNNQEAAFGPGFASQTEDSSFLSSLWSLNDAAAVGSGMMHGSSEDVINNGSSGVPIDQERFPSEVWMTNQSLSMANATGRFDLFDVPFIDNLGDDVGPPTQHLDNANNAVFFLNQYVPNCDFGVTNVGEPGPSAINNNLTSYPGFGQRSNETQDMISKTGCTAPAAIPNISMPSTSEALNIDGNRTQWPLAQMGGSNNDDPTIPVAQILPPSTLLRENAQSTLFPTSNTSLPSQIDNDENMNITSTTSSRNKKRYPKKLLPSKSLYIIEKGKYICRYKGPARPEGCAIKSREVRYLCRHLRTHALKEREMDIAEEDRVACNGVPEELLYLSVSCPFKKEADRGKCRYYRETGTIWQVETLDRWEKVMDRHKAEYHDTGGGL